MQRRVEADEPLRRGRQHPAFRVGDQGVDLAQTCGFEVREPRARRREDVEAVTETAGPEVAACVERERRDQIRGGRLPRLLRTELREGEPSRLPPERALVG